MNVPKPGFILQTTQNKDNWPQLSAEETEHTLKCAEENSFLPVNSATESHSTRTELPRNADEQGDIACSNRKCFKVPLSIDDSENGLTSGRISRMLLTPVRFSKLLDLNFSLPSSPRTPCPRTQAVTSSQDQQRLATPVRHIQRHNGLGDQSVLNTPCVMGALQELQMAQDAGLPDMLALIEDDLTGLSQVEKQLLRNTDVELTDLNVVDYLLDVAQDHAQDQPSASAAASAAAAPTGSAPRGHGHPNNNNNFNNLRHQHRRFLLLRDAPSGQGQGGPSALNVRRKRRRRGGEKRMTSEEALSIRRQRSSRAARARARAWTELTSSQASSPETSAPSPSTVATKARARAWTELTSSQASSPETSAPSPSTVATKARARAWTELTSSQASSPATSAPSPSTVATKARARARTELTSSQASSPETSAPSPSTVATQARARARTELTSSQASSPATSAPSPSTVATTPEPTTTTPPPPLLRRNSPQILIAGRECDSITAGDATPPLLSPSRSPPLQVQPSSPSPLPLGPLPKKKASSSLTPVPRRAECKMRVTAKSGDTKPAETPSPSPLPSPLQQKRKAGTSPTPFPKRAEYKRRTKSRDTKPAEPSSPSSPGQPRTRPVRSSCQLRRSTRTRRQTTRMEMTW